MKSIEHAALGEVMQASSAFVIVQIAFNWLVDSDPRRAVDDGSTVESEAEVEIAPGERVRIVGESGSGKSTLVRAISRPWP